MPPSSSTARRQPMAPMMATISGEVNPNGSRSSAPPSPSKRVIAMRMRPSRSSPMARRESRWVRSTPRPPSRRASGTSPSPASRVG
jgi:hypothetical protein